MEWPAIEKTLQMLSSCVVAQHLLKIYFGFICGCARLIQLN